MTTKSELLARASMFQLLDETERAELAERLETRSIEAGKAIFSAGEPGDELYVVASGVVEIFVKNHTGDRIVLETLGEGSVFGEISLLDGGARTASAVARQDGQLFVLDRDGLDAFLRRCPAAAIDLLAAMGQRLRETARLLRGTATRNVNEEAADARTLVQRAADWIADFSGSLSFLFLHAGVFTAWISLNSGPLSRTRIGGFDPFPYGFLTMCVSLEAIFLSVFVLLSQNRQAARERVRNDIEYDVNLKAELEISALHEKIDDLREDLLSRLRQLERRT